MLLTAQINYKLARYETAAEIYGKLISVMPKEDIPDLLTNLVACSANQSSLYQKVQDLV